MPSFGKKSLEKRSQLHPDLQKLVDLAIQKIDFSIIEGERTEAEQNKAFAEGKSKAKFPQSKHNKHPSEAFDFIPSPFTNWNDTKAFDERIEVFIECAKQLGITIRAGRDFTHLKDYPHIEILFKKP